MAINGFDQETKPLTDKERGYAVILAKVLQARVGKGSAINSAEIIAGFRTKVNPPVRLTGSRVRKLINHIRVNHLVLNVVATSEGYYVENDPREILKYVSSLQQRVDAMVAVIKSYK